MSCLGWGKKVWGLGTCEWAIMTLNQQSHGIEMSYFGWGGGGEGSMYGGEVCEQVIVTDLIVIQQGHGIEMSYFGWGWGCKHMWGGGGG